MPKNTYFVISFKDGLDANETVIKLHLRYPSLKTASKAYNQIPLDLVKLFSVYKIEIPDDPSKVKVTKVKPTSIW